MIAFDDYRQIERLIYLYPYYLDDGRFAEMGELFADADLYVGTNLVAHRDAAAVAEVWARTGSPRSTEPGGSPSAESATTCSATWAITCSSP